MIIVSTSNDRIIKLIFILIIDDETIGNYLFIEIKKVIQLFYRSGGGFAIFYSNF
jgi:hypothetical protein